MFCPHNGGVVVVVGVSSSSTCNTCHVVSISAHGLRSIEEHGGGMGGRPVGWYFLGKDGLMVILSWLSLLHVCPIVLILLNGL